MSIEGVCFNNYNHKQGCLRLKCCVCQRNAYTIGYTPIQVYHCDLEECMLYELLNTDFNFDLCFECIQPLLKCRINLYYMVMFRKCNCTKNVCFMCGSSYEIIQFSIKGEETEILILQRFQAKYKFVTDASIYVCQLCNQLFIDLVKLHNLYENCILDTVNVRRCAFRDQIQLYYLDQNPFRMCKSFDQYLCDEYKKVILLTQNNFQEASTVNIPVLRHSLPCKDNHSKTVEEGTLKSSNSNSSQSSALLSFSDQSFTSQNRTNNFKYEKPVFTLSPSDSSSSNNSSRSSDTSIMLGRSSVSQTACNVVPSTYTTPTCASNSKSQASSGLLDFWSWPSKPQSSMPTLKRGTGSHIFSSMYSLSNNNKLQLNSFWDQYTWNQKISSLNYEPAAQKFAAIYSSWRWGSDITQLETTMKKGPYDNVTRVTILSKSEIPINSEFYIKSNTHEEQDEDSDDSSDNWACPKKYIPQAWKSNCNKSKALIRKLSAINAKKCEDLFSHLLSIVDIIITDAYNLLFDDVICKLNNLDCKDVTLSVLHRVIDEWEKIMNNLITNIVTVFDKDFKASFLKSLLDPCRHQMHSEKVKFLNVIIHFLEKFPVIYKQIYFARLCLTEKDTA